MDYMLLVATLVGQLATISKDPALGYRGQALTEALALLATIIGKGEEARAQLELLANQIEAMVAEKREPTKAEWGHLRDLSRANHAILNPPPPSEPAAEDNK